MKVSPYILELRSNVQPSLNELDHPQINPKKPQYQLNCEAPPYVPNQATVNARTKSKRECRVGLGLGHGAKSKKVLRRGTIIKGGNDRYRGTQLEA